MKKSLETLLKYNLTTLKHQLTLLAHKVHRTPFAELKLWDKKPKCSPNTDFFPQGFTVFCC